MFLRLEIHSIYELFHLQYFSNSVIQFTIWIGSFISVKNAFLILHAFCHGDIKNKKTHPKDVPKKNVWLFF